MTDIDFRKETILSLREKLLRGDLSSRDLVKASRERIQERNGELNAFIEVFDDTFTPESLNEGDSLLKGIPFAVKDNILFKGKKATGGSHILKGYRATYDAKVAEILKERGASLVGRVNMDEMAMGTSTATSFYGPTKNPHDLDRVPGGSSGGSAAAVADGMVVYALGSDTGGSIRQPASLCGVVGLKPSYGSVSRRGLMAMASSLDVIGPITQSVTDAEIIFKEISAYDELDATSVPLEVRTQYQEKNRNRKKIGVPWSFVRSEGVQREVLENFETSLERMRELGYEIIDIDIPLMSYALAMYYILQPAEVSSNMARYDGIRYGLSEEGETILDVYQNTRSRGFGKEVQRRIMLGTYVLSSGYHDAYYYKARAAREALKKQVREIFDQVDIIATPTAPSTAFRFDEKKDPISLYLEDIFTVPYNLTGNPAISIPSGFDSRGLPFGMHFSAPLFCEDKLFEVGKDFESLVEKNTQ